MTDRHIHVYINMHAHTHTHTLWTLISHTYLIITLIILFLLQLNNSQSQFRDLSAIISSISSSGDISNFVTEKSSSVVYPPPRNMFETPENTHPKQVRHFENCGNHLQHYNATCTCTCTCTYTCTCCTNEPYTINFTPLLYTVYMYIDPIKIVKDTCTMYM